MSGLKKIDNVMFKVDDLEKSAEFYEHVMGLKRGWTDVENRMIGLLFPGNDSELVLHVDDSLPNPNVSFQVENVLRFIKEFRKKGYRVVVEPFGIRCGICAVLSDLSGNMIEVMDISKFDDKPRFDE